jgi:hypothetical protein
MLSEETVNRRKSIRFRLMHPLYAEICLSRVQGQPWESGNARVMLVDIGRGGSRFRTYLKIPPRRDVEWRFRFSLGEDPIMLSGRVVWTMSEGSMWVYGVQWNRNDVTKQGYIQRFQHFVLKQIGSNARILQIYRMMIDRDKERSASRVDYTT